MGLKILKRQQNKNSIYSIALSHIYQQLYSITLSPLLTDILKLTIVAFISKKICHRFQKNKIKNYRQINNYKQQKWNSLKP